MYEKFEKLLKQKRVRIADVARETGIRPAFFSDWKKRGTNPRIEKLKPICDYFGVTVDYFTEDGERDGYYINPETVKKAQELFENPGMRILFDAAQDASPEDLQAAADILILLKKKGNID